MVGLRPDCITLIAASCASRKMQLSVLSFVGNLRSQIYTRGTSTGRKTVTATTMPASGVADAVEPCRRAN